MLFRSGDKFNFYFQKSGGNKGAGITGEKDDKYYQSGMLMTAGSDEKYQIITPAYNTTTDDQGITTTTLIGYDKYDDVADLVDNNIFVQQTNYTDASLRALGINKDAEDVAELYVPVAASTAQDHILINTSGKVIDNKGKSKDGNDYYYVVNNTKKVVAIYLEN